MVDSPETSSNANIEAMAQQCEDCDIHATQPDQDGVFYETFLHYVEFSKYFVSC